MSNPPKRSVKFGNSEQCFETRFSSKRISIENCVFLIMILDPITQIWL